MKKVITYGVSTSEGDINILVRDVNDHMKEGYQPLGGIVLTTCGDVVVFAQAMVKYEESNSP